MNKFFRYIAPALALVMASCDDVNHVMPEIEEPGDNMRLSATATNLVLTQAHIDDEAVTFYWADAADRGPTATITYLFRIAPTDNLGDAELKEVTGRSVTYTTEQLNDVLDEYGIRPGAQTELTAQVIAKVYDETKFHKPEVSTAAVLVTGFAPELTPKYLINPAHDPRTNLWVGAMDSPAMKEVELGKVYEWTGWFEADKPVQISDDALGNDVVTEASVKADGYYTLTWHKSGNAVTTELCIPWDMCYLTGTALPGSGELNDAIYLVSSGANPEIFSWTGTLKKGTLKALSEKSLRADAFVPPVDGLPAGSSDIVVVAENGRPNNSWSVERQGECRIELNLNLMTIKFIWTNDENN
ncbi:MAG: SusE domain-containing protein [Muribaculaceae bacterium]|nr:SusE domain-containing protein [Muribaculaceae bacterium]